MALYTSSLFTKSRAWVERTCDDWAILSALHGLTPVDRIIEPYDKTLNTMRAAERRQWASRVNKQIRETWSVDTVSFVVLAGLRYRTALDGIEHEVPMRGLGIGQQLAWLKRALVGT